jgi:hypothetical protein
MGRRGVRQGAADNERVQQYEGEAIVEDDDCRQPVACRGAGKPQTMIAVCVVDQEVKAIGALQSYAGGVDVSGQRSVSFRRAIGRRDESHTKWGEIWTPD